MGRKLLFSSNSLVNSRRKLFSDNQGGVTNQELKRVQCADCGHIMVVNGGGTNYSCPKCGAKNRFNVFTVTPSPNNVPEAVQVDKEKLALVDKEFTRRSLFEDKIQKEFSEPSNEYELKLKKYSGKVIKDGDVEKLFGVTSDKLIDDGVAKYYSDNELKINDSAYLQSKLFSKLIISVTKTLELDPSITISDKPKECLLDELQERGNLNPKSIMIIKKAHGFPLISKEFSSNDDVETWAKDSGIVSDLKLEYGNSGMTVKEFTNILNERYPDAPEHIIDYLISNGVVKIQGNQVDVMR